MPSGGGFMDILTFENRFPDEKACEQLLKNLRWPDSDFTCPECGSHDFSEHEFRKYRQCSSCGRQVYWRSGTLFENTNLSLKAWFWGIYLMVECKKSISRMELSRRLGVAYSTANRMANRIQSLMGEADRDESLSGIVKLDVAHFESEHSGTDRKAVDGQMPVFVACEVEPEEQKPRKFDHPPLRRVLLVPAPNLETESAEEFVQEHIEPGTDVRTDAGRNFEGMDLDDYIHKKTNLSKHESSNAAGELFPWVHILISNAKRLLSGTFHSVSKEYLGEYLNEFSFRLNHQDEKSIFNRFLFCAIDPPKSRQAVENVSPR